MKRNLQTILRSSKYWSVNAASTDIYPHLELYPEVPRLPIPTVEETLDRYKEYVRPLVNDEEYENTLKLIEKFQEEDADFLQEELMKLDELSPTSYIEGYWDTAYNTMRCELPININPYFIYRQKHNDQVSAATMILSGCAEFQIMLENNEIEREYEGKAKVPLCMSQYRNLFGCCKIPKPDRDLLLKHPDTRHAVVLVNNQFYRLDIINEDRTRPMYDDELRSCLEGIIEDAYKTDDAPAVGALTTQKRSIWAEHREHLDQATLDEIDSALFVCNLFNESPSNLEEMSRILCHSDGLNCWYDKLQIFVTNNGMTGLNMEHSPYDGHTILSLGTYIVENHEGVNSPTGELNLDFDKLEFEKTPELEGFIDVAVTSFSEFAGKTDTYLMEFEDYGAELIKSIFKCSPDSFVQMMYQLAFYKIYEEAGSTYESCLTKKWFHGRTETIRSCSPESLDFCKIYVDPSKTVDEKKEALWTATATQVQRSIDAKEGRAVDRHLYALQMIASECQARLPNFDMPEFFTDTSLGKLRYDRLSTSNCGSTDVVLFGFGPVTERCTGLGYLITNDGITTNVTNYEGKAELYRDTLVDTLREFRVMFEESQ